MKKKRVPGHDPSPGTRHTSPGSPRPVVVALALAAAAVVAYARAVGYGFVFIDDYLYVYQNPHVLGGLTPDNVAWAWTTGHASNWHPLTWMSLQLDATLFGPDPVGYHLTNVLLHAANTALVFLTLHRLTGAAGRSAAVALLFALHPLHVESVAWVAERKDVLSGLFWLLTTLAYIRYAEAPSAGRMAAVVALFALGLAAKQMLVTLPCVLLLLDYWPLARLRSRADARPLVREKLPLFALTAAACVVTVVVQARGGAVANLQIVTPYDRLAGAPVGYVVYLWKTVWPADLSVQYPYPPRRPWWHPAAAGALLAVVTAAAVRLRRAAPYFLVGWLWFLGTLVPVIGLIQVGTQPYADRYTYLPHVGLFLAVVWGLADLAARYRVPAAVTAGLTAAVAAGCLAGTWHQVRFWENSQVLWDRALAVDPENPTAHYNIAAEHMDAGRWAEAVRSLTEAGKAQPGAFDIRSNRAVALYQLGRLAEAEDDARAALAVVPPGATSPVVGSCWLILAEGSRRRGQHAEAITQYEESLRHTDTAPARLGLGVMLTVTGRPADAVPHLRAARDLAPGHADAHYCLGLALDRAGDRAGALAAFREAVRLRPENADYRAALATAERAGR